MAEYESIHGTRVRYLSSDPTLTDSSTEGQVWYNSTTGTNKAFVQIKATSTGGNMGTGRYGVGGAGTQTAGLAFTGSPGSSPYLSNATEEYGGFNWSAGGNYPISTRFAHGAGTQTAALGFMSDVAPLQLSAEYDGSSWTAGNSLTVPRNRGGGSSNSTQTAGLAFGGNPLSNTTEEYDGTNWTTGGNLNTSRRENPGAGTQTAGLAMGGKNAPGGNTTTTETEEYNGTSWTVVSGVLPTGTSNFNNGAGTQSDAALFGGSNTSGTKISTIQEYDGVVWSNSSATLASNRSSAGIGTRAQGLIFGGLGTTTLNTTEEYDSRFEAITTTAAWASGGNYPAPVYGAGSGTNAPQTAAVAFGGNVSGSKSTATNEYNGSSWTSANAMSDAFIFGACAGTQTAAFGAGGYSAPPSRTAATEEYDGTNWTSGGNLSVAAAQNVGFGTLTAGVAYGGEGSPDPVIKTSTQEYDGSSWTTVNTMPIGAAGCGTGFGTQTAGVRNGGTAPTPNPSTWDGGPASFVNITLLYDGTNWTTGAFSNFGGRNSTGFGVQTSGVTAGGEGAPATNGLTRTEQYDGTSWTDVATIPRVSTSYMAGFGASSGSGAVVGGVHTVTNSTDEYTGQVLTTQASTLTTS